MRLFNEKHTRLKLMHVNTIILVSIISIFSLHENTLYAVPNNGTGNTTTQPLTEDNNSTSNTPSVIHLSPLNNTNTNNNALSTATSESSNGNNANSNDTGSNSATHHAHYGTSRNQHKDNSNNSHDLTNKIINKSKQKLKVGDIPFP
jgi:hypothetical protein